MGKVSNKSSPIRTRGSKRRKKTEILTSLKDNQNNEQTENSDSDDDRDKKQCKKEFSKSDDDISATYNCDICHKEDPEKEKYRELDIKVITEFERSILRVKDSIEAKILCKRHYQNKIVNWLCRQTKCCNPLSLHKKSKATKRNASLTLARKCRNYEIVDVIPGQKMCWECEMKLKVSLEMGYF